MSEFFVPPSPVTKLLYTIKPTEGGWSAEAIDMADEGQCYRAIFTGPDAYVRASKYASWMNKRSLTRLEEGIDR